MSMDGLEFAPGPICVHLCSSVVPFLLAALAVASLGCQRMRRPAHGTIRARRVDVMLDGLRPTLVADLRVEVIGALPGAAYDLGPAFAAAVDGRDGGGTEWRCVGEACSTPVDASSELYPLELRYLLDQLAEEPGFSWPLHVRFELRERRGEGPPRVVAAGEPLVLDKACRRLERVPLRMRRIGGGKAGAEGELAAEAVRAAAGCEGPVLHAELSYRVAPLPGGAPVVRLAVGLPGFDDAACRGLHCEVTLEPPDRGTVVIDKPLGPSLATLGRAAARAEVRLFLERRGANAATGALDQQVFELASPGAGIVP
jgi:hypothetical protein